MIQFNQVSYFLPQGFLFENIKVQVNNGEKIGLTGKNGAGKSTLLKLISGEISPTEGDIHIPKELNIGYLKQEIIFENEGKVFDYLDHSNSEYNRINLRLNKINEQITIRTDYESESYLDLLTELNELNQEFDLLEGHKWKEKIELTLKGLGFEESDFEKDIDQLSGGWKMRLELARILINSPDILLLDEPTNHLDIVSIGWLEKFLIKFEGIVIIISHDRHFLDAITKRTLEISLRKIIDYPYPYTLYIKKREEDLLLKENEKKQQEKEIKHTEKLIAKFRAKSSKAAFAQSLIKKLEKTEIIEIENRDESSIKIHFPLSVKPGKHILEIENLSKHYPDKQLLNQVSIHIGRGEKIALLGANGIGKSTLLKCITNEIEYEGNIRYGHNVNVTYFAQDQAEKLDSSKTVFEIVDDVAVGEIRSKLRGILGSFLFSSDDISKKVSALSGGEKTRLALCQLLLSPSNFLILDEPTNHLDIASKNILKNALINYEGTFIVVSHDRDFLHGLTNRIWDISAKKLRVHHFDLPEYLRFVEDRSVGTQMKKTKEVKIKKKKSSYSTPLKAQKELDRLEKKISRLEKELKITETHLAENPMDLEKGMNEWLSKYAEQKQMLDKLMKEWEVKMSDIENTREQE